MSTIQLAYMFVYRFRNAFMSTVTERQGGWGRRCGDAKYMLREVSRVNGNN